MKKALILTNVLTICLLYFVSWKKDDNVAASCIKYDYTNVSRVGKLSAGTAVQLASGFNERMKNVPLAKGKQHTRSVLFTLETMKNFLWEIERQACTTLNSKEIPDLGVRIYFSVYPDEAPMRANPDLHIPDKKYDNSMTVFMVPAYDDKGVYYDCDPGLPTKSKLVKIKDVMPHNATAPGPRPDARLRSSAPRYPSILMLTSSNQWLLKKPSGGSGDTKSSIQNHGSLVPPDNEDGNAF